MKIMVTRKDGSVEAITLTEPVTVERGDPLNVLVTSTGMRHYFNFDGVYDGWELDVSKLNMTWDEAKEFALKVDSEREFPERPNETIAEN